MISTVNVHLFVLILICNLDYIILQTSNKTFSQKIEDIFGKPKPKFPIPTDNIDNNETCVCVPYYLCNDNGVNLNGEGIIDIRNNENVCESYWEWCCKKPNFNKNSIIPTPSPRSGCGYINPKGALTQTIGDINGEAKFGEFPWMVAILKEEIENSTVFTVYKCGGALIHPKVVLTAAHCINNKENTLIVRAGEWDTSTEKEILKHQNRKAESIIVHPDFYRGGLHNDIGLIILEQSFNLDQHINVACLPPQGTTIPSGTRCWATGWGQDLFRGKGKYPVILKKIELPIMDKRTCENNLRTTRLGKYFRLHESFVCAGGEPGKDTCKGDGGSPLICPITNQQDRYQQVGTVAWGIGCGDKNIPGVYGNVALFRDWIDNQMAIERLDFSQYQF